MCAHAVGAHVLVVATFGFCGRYQIEEYILCLFCVCVCHCLNSVDRCSVGVCD